jgi:hypothetical protein
LGRSNRLSATLVLERPPGDGAAGDAKAVRCA